MKERKNIEMSRSEFKELKERTFGKKDFVIEGDPNICFGCGKELNIKKRFLKGYNYCCSCYKELTGLEDQFDLGKFNEFLYRNANRKAVNHNHFVKKGMIFVSCLEINLINKGATNKNKKDSRVKL